MESFECITLDDSDEEGSSIVQVPAGGVQLLLVEPKMVRCNLCLEPGLLPVETDRARHR